MRPFLTGGEEYTQECVLRDACRAGKDNQDDNFLSLGLIIRYYFPYIRNSFVVYTFHQTAAVSHDYSRKKGLYHLLHRNYLKTADIEIRGKPNWTQLKLMSKFNIQ